MAKIKNKKSFNIKNINKYLKSRGNILFFLVLVLGFFNIVLLMFLLSPGKKNPDTQNSKTSAYKNDLPKDFSEVNELSQRNDWSIKSISDYFKALANKKGAVYAYEVLKRAPIPPNIDLHLLGHDVGEVLYKQQGIEGIKYCTEDFRNACSHAIVINMFYKKADKAIPQITEVCHRAPGGPGAYTMCFHGLGHGILAYTGYDFPKTVELCQKTKTKDYYGREFAECVGGAVMEIISGGGHDQATWQRQRPKYLNPSDALSLCKSQFMPSETNDICYTYITPFLFEAAGANLASPTEENYKNAFVFCSNMPKQTQQDLANRANCFGGFGKEFVVLAKSRDIRDVGSMTKEELLTVYRWCTFANETDGTIQCLRTALQSLFWGGENNPDASFSFCAILENQYKDYCYGNLVGTIRQYIVDPAKRTDLCKRLPEVFRADCYK